MATIAENLDRIVGAKEAIRGAIIDKGVQVPSDAKIDEYSAFVGQIQGGGGEDTLKMYIDGTIVKDGVLDLSNYDTLARQMFNDERWRHKADKIILSPNLETIPYSCFEYIHTPLVENLDKVKYIEGVNSGMTDMNFINLDSCITELSNVGNSHTHTKMYGENVKIIALEGAYNLENLYIYSLVMPKIVSYENVGGWVSSRTLHCHCWMDESTTNILVTDKEYKVEYLEQIISQTYTGETSFDVSDVNIHLTLPYSFVYTEDGEERTKDVVYDKELFVYPVKEETTKVVPITTAQSTDEFTLNIKPFPLKAPDMDLYYEFDVVEDCVINNNWWRTDSDKCWVVWCDGELTTPETIHNFKKGERHTFGIRRHDRDFPLSEETNIFASGNTRHKLKPYYVEINDVKFDTAVFRLQYSKWCNEKFTTFVISKKNSLNYEFSYCAKDVIYLDGVANGYNFTYNGVSTANFYIVANTLDDCGYDIREYIWYTERPKVYLKGELAQQLWDEDEYFKRYIYKYDID